MNPPPDGDGPTPPWTDPHDTFTADDGARLHVARARPPGTPRAHLVITHGFAEHGDRYRSLAAACVRRGFAVHALDLRGHGRSPGRRTLVRRAERLVRDLDGLLAWAGQQGAPVLAFGHSFGGAITARVVQQRPDVATAVALSAPYLRTALREPAWLLALADVASRVAPALRTRPIDAGVVSSLPAEVRRYREDPLVDTGGVRLASVRELHALGARVLRDAHLLTTPTLIVHGDDDRLADPEGSRALARDAGAAVRLHPVAGGWHALLHDREATETCALVTDWFETRLQAAVEPDASAGPATWGPSERSRT